MTQRFNGEDLARITGQPGYSAVLPAVHPGRPKPTPVLERRDKHAPLPAAQTQKEDPGRLRISVTSFRLRLLDDDNLCEKYHIDALRYAKVIKDDARPKVTIVTTQEPVTRKEDERTEIKFERI